MGASSAPNRAARAGAGRALPETYFRSERERLLEAMLRTAAAQGYAMTTVADVVAAADSSVESFEELFGDKESCFLEAYDGAIDVALAQATAAFEAAPEDPWPARVEAALRALVELFAAEAEIIRMAMTEVGTLSDEGRGRYGVALARFAPFLEAGSAHSAQGEELPAETAAFALGGAGAMISDEVRAGRGPELRGILPELLFTLLMPYLGPEAAEEEMRRVAREG